MTRTDQKLPGAGVVLALLAVAIVATTWLWAGRVPVSTAGRPVVDMRVDINRAGAAELDVLPGFGPRTAERIVADREARGPFASLEDLVRVPGVGPVVVERVAPMAVAGTGASDSPTAPETAEEEE